MCPNAKGNEGQEPTGDVGVGSRLEGPQAVADDEDADAEAGKGAVQDGGDRQQGAKAVEEEAPDEYGSIAVVAQDPGGVPKGSQGVGADGVTENVSGRQECGGGGTGGGAVESGHTHPK